MRKALGHGYRVEARIVTWETDEAVIVPTSAMFRAGDNWAVFVFSEGKAVQRLISVGHENGVSAEVLDGLQPGEIVVLYPSAMIEDGISVARRLAE